MTAEKLQIFPYVIIDGIHRHRIEGAVRMRMECEFDHLRVKFPELFWAHQCCPVVIPSRPIASIGCRNENRRFRAMSQQKGERIFEIVEIPVVKSEKQRTLRQ